MKTVSPDPHTEDRWKSVSQEAKHDGAARQRADFSAISADVMSVDEADDQLPPVLRLSGPEKSHCSLSATAQLGPPLPPRRNGSVVHGR